MSAVKALPPLVIRSGVTAGVGLQVRISTQKRLRGQGKKLPPFPAPQRTARGKPACGKGNAGAGVEMICPFFCFAGISDGQGHYLCLLNKNGKRNSLDMKRLPFYFGAALLVILLLPGFAGAGRGCGAKLVRVPASNLTGLWIDDDISATLETALQESIRYMDKQPDAVAALYDQIPPRLLRESLQALLHLVRKNLSKQEFLQCLRREFDFFSFAGKDGAPSMLVTGYFEPEYPASLVRRKPYLYPLYGVPDDLVESENGRPGKKRVFRRQDNMLFSYWSRKEIETRNLLAGRELVYLADPVAAFVLQVQGSGRLRLTDGSLRRIRYAGNNGLPYKSIGRLLVEKGIMPLEQVSMPSIIKYLRGHPAELRQILYYNDRYIFFAWDHRSHSEGQGPVGSIGAPLVAGRSVALDPRSYPPGLVGFLNTTQPRFDKKGRLFSWVSLHRLVVNQDSGAAIAGPFRLDLFCGHGPYAQKTAGIMRQRADFYVVLKKTADSRK